MRDHSFHHKFKFCSTCGSENFTVNDEKSKRCNDCGFVFYFNSSAAVAAFICNEKGQLLLTRRAKNPAKGMLDLPGGFVDMNETAEQAIAREIKEELNLDVKSLKYLFSLPNVYRYSELDIHTLDLFFEVKISDFSCMKADDDVSEAFFINKKDIKIQDIAFSSISSAVEIYRDAPPTSGKPGGLWADV